MYYIYILLCSDDSLYTGITKNLIRRIKEHNWELLWWAKYTLSRKPVKLLYYEKSNNRSDATKREIEIKKLTRNKKLELIQNNNMQKVIGVDMDEVLAELVDYALEHHDYKIRWKVIKRENIIDYYIHHLVDYDLSLEDALEWFRSALFSDNDHLCMKPVIWAIEKLKEHIELGYSFKIVTARNGDLFWEYTKKWIEKHYPGIFDDIIFANHFSKEEKTKSQICIENNIFHMVEDNIDYALDLAKSGIITYLIKKPWNMYREESHHNMIRVKSWDEIYFD